MLHGGWELQGRTLTSRQEPLDEQAALRREPPLLLLNLSDHVQGIHQTERLRNGAQDSIEDRDNHIREYE